VVSRDPIPAKCRRVESQKEVIISRYITDGDTNHEIMSSFNIKVLINQKKNFRFSLKNVTFS
jgi:hypothetical protein